MSHANVERYATTELVDDAIAWLGEQPEPFVLWLALNAPHAPFHVPPEDLHSVDDLGVQGDCPEGRRSDCYGAAVEAMDSEIGRLLAHLDDGRLDRTWVIFVGDNGTPAQVAQPPVVSLRSKNSLYEGGVRVPLIVAGPGLSDPDRAVDPIVDVSDLHATILQLTGAELPSDRTLDSVSLVPYLLDPAAPPQRTHTLAQLEASSPDDDKAGDAIRDERFKYIRFADGREELYDLDADPWEDDELLADPPPEATAAYEALAAALDALLEE